MDSNMNYLTEEINNVKKQVTTIETSMQS